MRKVKDVNLKKVFTTPIIISILANMNRVYADVVTEVEGGGEIQSSKLGQGLLNMVKDVTGTMQWILPVVRSMFYFVLCI